MTFIETSNLAGAALVSRRGNSSWTDERELEVHKLWRAGYTASQIAIEIGGTTRNAVIGKLHRAGLTMSHRTPGVKIKCDPSARLPGSKPGRRPDGYRRRALPKTPIARPFAEPEIIVLLGRNEAACTFAQLGRDTCRYPYGEPHAADFAFCGRSSEGRTYCSGHARICYQPSAPRRDKVSRR